MKKIAVTFLLLGLFLIMGGCGSDSSSNNQEQIPETCGNGVLDDGEQCDGTNLAGETCDGLGYIEVSPLSCFENCQFNLNGCVNP